MLSCLINATVYGQWYMKKNVISAFKRVLPNVTQMTWTLFMNMWKGINVKPRLRGLWWPVSYSAPRPPPHLTSNTSRFNPRTGTSAISGLVPFDGVPKAMRLSLFGLFKVGMRNKQFHLPIAILSEILTFWGHIWSDDSSVRKCWNMKKTMRKDDTKKWQIAT